MKETAAITQYKKVLRDTKKLVKDVRSFQKNLRSDQIVDFWNELKADYCVCGRYLIDDDGQLIRCYCQCDD